MIKMYDNIAALEFNDGMNGEKIASAMISAEKEKLEFKKAVVAEGRVEDWMTAVLNEMRTTNRLGRFSKTLFDWLLDLSRNTFLKPHLSH